MKDKLAIVLMIVCVVLMAASCLAIFVVPAWILFQQGVVSYIYARVLVRIIAAVVLLISAIVLFVVSRYM